MALLLLEVTRPLQLPLTRLPHLPVGEGGWCLLMR